MKKPKSRILDATEFLHVLREKAPIRTQPRYRSKSGNALEISIFDIHHGKLAWASECGASYDLKHSERLFREAVEYFLDLAKPFNIERIIFPIGQDFFHVDNSLNTTTAGTPQDVDSRWQKSFMVGKSAMIDGILKARKAAPVDVIQVAGNHDMERSFYLGEVLKAWFRNTKGVEVDNRPTSRKYYQWGKCLTGFTHGDKEKMGTLPILMATETPHQFAATKFREWHTGHLHTKRETSFKTVDEFNAIRVRVIPSLTPADSWHKGKGYSNLRAAEAFVVGKDSGFVANLSYSV